VGQSGSAQTHDFDAGIRPYPNGLFWTLALSRSSVTVNLDAATASMRVSNLAVLDYFTIPNALTNGQLVGPPVPATVSFDLQWSGATRQVRERTAAETYVANLIYTNARLAWSAQEAGFSFVSAPANTSTSLFAAIGKERDGSFFS
jgi:hypothetical protein